MPELEATEEERRRAFERLQAGGRASEPPTEEERKEGFAAIQRGGQPALKRRAGGPLRSRRSAPVPEELEGIPAGERAVRGGRILAGEGLGPGGLGGLAATAADTLEALGSGLPSQLPSTIAEKLEEAETGEERRTVGDVISEGSAALQHKIQGEVQPADPTERFISKVGQEGAASAAIIGPIRHFSKAKVALSMIRGKRSPTFAGPLPGRVVRAIAGETEFQFLLGEGLSIVGAAAGRQMFEEAGEGMEILGAIMGDVGLRTIPRKMWDATTMIVGGLARIRFKTIPAQDRAILEEILKPIRERGKGGEPIGLDKWLENPRNQRLWDDASEQIVRFAGSREAALAADELGLEIERLAVELNVDPNDLVAGLMADHKGLSTLAEMAIARNPLASTNIQAATARGNRALAMEMARQGVPDSVPGNPTQAVRAAVQDEVDREMKRVTAEVEELKAAHQASVDVADQGAVGQLRSPGAEGGIPDKGAARDLQFDASTAFAERREAARLRVKKKKIDPLYEHARRVSDENSDVLFGVSNTKDALARIKEPLRKAGESEAPTKFFGFIEEWPTSGVDFATLQDMRKTLGNASKKLKKAGDFAGGEMLDELRRGVIADIENYELLARVGVEGPGQAVARAGAGPENTIGLVLERSRQLVSEAMDAANAGARALAEEFYEGASGRIFKALRTKNPVQHSYQFGMFLKHTGPGYPERIDELARIARGNEALGIAPSPEIMQGAVDWLVADAYSRTVKVIERADGTSARRMDLKALDTWKGNNARALNAFPEAKRVTDDADELVRKARRLNAEPLADVKAANVSALEGFVDDPQNYWTGVAGHGPTRGIEEVDRVIKIVKGSGDAAAWAGLKDSFWTSEWMRQATDPNQGGITPLQSLNAVQGVLDTPQLRHAVTQLYGPTHVRLLEKFVKLKRVLVEGGGVAGGKVQPLELETAGAQAEKALRGSSLMTVIYGTKRRILKIGTVLDEFTRSLDTVHKTAIVQEAANNPALLHEALTRSPSEKITRSIRTRMSLAAPSLFERVPAASENTERRREEIRKRKEAEALKNEPPNRGILNPPRASLSITSPNY